MLNRFNILFWKIGRDIPKSGTQSFNSMEASKLLNFLNGDVSKGFILEKNKKYIVPAQKVVNDYISSIL